MTPVIDGTGSSLSCSEEARCSTLRTSAQLKILAMLSPELEGLISAHNGRGPTASWMSLLTRTEEEKPYSSDFPIVSRPTPATTNRNPRVNSTRHTSGTDTSASIPQTILSVVLHLTSHKRCLD
ncbi:hypothetical protein MRX96_014040 [Rhipicephalus microplus]